MAEIGKLFCKRKIFDLVRLISATFDLPNEASMKANEPMAERVVTAIYSIGLKPPIALHEPQFRGNEWAYLKDCVDSSFVSYVGKFVDRFEKELAGYCGADYAIAVVNGTAALHIALRLAGVHEGDEVLVPDMTFVATANAVMYCGAIPHFIDCEERTLGIAAGPLRDYLGRISYQSGGHCVDAGTGRVIRAIVPVHTFGHPCDLDGILSVANDFNLVVVEDAAESLGSFYHGRHTGTFGLMGTLSFNGNKTITTGGGGAILTNDAVLAQRAKHLTTTAKIPHRWAYEHDEVGYNYRMPNLNAALGCAQMELLPAFLASKRRLFDLYSDALGDIPYVKVMREPEGCRSNYWLQTLVLDESVAGDRDSVLASTNHAGLATRPVWNLMHRLKPFQHCPRAPLPVAGSLSQRIINLPSSAGLV